MNKSVLIASLFFSFAVGLSAQEQSCTIPDIEHEFQFAHLTLFSTLKNKDDTGVRWLFRGDDMLPGDNSTVVPLYVNVRESPTHAEMWAAFQEAWSEAAYIALIRTRSGRPDAQKSLPTPTH